MTREEAEKLFGPIKTVCNCPPIPTTAHDWSAYFDNYCDVDAPGWSHADGATESEAVETLIEQADENLCENCNEQPGYRMRSGFDVCPTDRGDERREFHQWVCRDCDRRRHDDERRLSELDRRVGC